ncbi:hypothetical protein [Sulfobacillus thermosulfidooxidans]|uniref:hypothetical protein n=1 Tax=Sulfobacillus thermosulfidooxidans TaxID=28034 RepID=UPI0006B59F75|nr:hypothetical protein [Sulfobacillus thermosulfidooxidans]
MKRTFVMIAAGLTVALAGCGTSQAAKSTPSMSKTSPSSSSMSSTSPSSSMSSSSSAMTTQTVAEIETNKTAQMVEAGNTATFVLTATTASGKPAKDLPVTFYIGPMVPLSGKGVSTWYTSGTAQAAKYIASYSKTTNSQGQATLTLTAQPTKSMEMVGVKIGNFSTFNPTAMKGAGLLDAWWTTSGTSPTAPVGDYVEVTPFAKAVKPGQKETLMITAMSPKGPISGAKVDIIPKTPSASSSMGGNSGMGGGMSSSGGTTMTTNSQGQVSYTVTAPSTSMASLPVRIVVSDNMERVAGGMNADVVAQ